MNQKQTKLYSQLEISMNIDKTLSQIKLTLT